MAYLRRFKETRGIPNTQNGLPTAGQSALSSAHISAARVAGDGGHLLGAELEHVRWHDRLGAGRHESLPQDLLELLRRVRGEDENLGLAPAEDMKEGREGREGGNVPHTHTKARAQKIRMVE